MKPRLVVFAKAPVIGGTKTRLAADIGQVQAWRIYRAMTARILRQVVDPRWDTLLAVSPDEALSRAFPGVWPDGYTGLACSLLLLEAVSKMHLTPKGCVTPTNRDYASIFIKIKVRIKPI